MKRACYSILFSFTLLFIAVSCTTPIEPDFTFSPQMPKAGQVVTFTNLTETGEKWNWTFGDGGTSMAHSPSYTYRRPGVYDITLRADSNNNFVITKQIIVYDTVPTIQVTPKTVVYYEDITFSVLAYNPYNFVIKYNWEFSDNAQGESLIDGKSTVASPIVFFNNMEVEETVKLEVQVGDSVYKIEKRFLVANQPALSLLMAESNGKILRQRIFRRGKESIRESNYSTGFNPFTIQAKNNKLYIFNAGSELSADKVKREAAVGDGSIVLINMDDNSKTELVHNRSLNASHGFYSGYVNGNYLFWSDFNQFIYRQALASGPIGAMEWKGSADLQTSLSYYFVKNERLGYFGNGMNDSGMNTGIYQYDFVYFWSKGGDGKGLYRFTQQDILSSDVTGTGVAPASGAILKDVAIRSFAIDHVNQKIYYAVTAPSDKVGFWVANLSGNNPVRIDDAPMDHPMKYITGIAVDHFSNRVYWAYRAPDGFNEAYFDQHPTHRTGVKMVRLAKNYNTDTAIEYFAPGVAAYGICIDDVKKY